MLADKEEIDFLGRLVWGNCTDWARNNSKAPPEWFRSWEELKPEEQIRYKLIGESLLTYFRASESTEVLKEELRVAEAKFEELRRLTIAEWKRKGGQ